jgi:hypothetical protein
MAFTQIEAAGITTTSTVVLQNATVTGVLTATSGFVGNLTGTVTGSVSGNVTGNLTGNVTGNLVPSSGVTINSPASNTLAFVTNNIEKIRVGTAGSIGIGTNIPEKMIDISGNHSGISTTSRFTLNPHSTGWDIAATAGNIAPHYQTNLSIYSGQPGSGTLRWSVDSSGRVTKPYQPAFQVRGNFTGSVTAGSKLAFTSSANNAKITFDIGSNWSDANNRFTAPVSGVYCFSFHIYRQSATSSVCSIAPRINGSEVSNGDTFIFFTSATGETGNSDDGASGSFFMNLSAGDYVELFVRSGANTILAYSGHSFFGGYLLG